MFKTGDLVRRVKVLSVTESYYNWMPYDAPVNEYGVVVDIEKPIDDYGVSDEDEIFVKILWQDPVVGATWHWGDEISLVKRGRAKK